MKRMIFFFSLMCAAVPSFGTSTSVESFYHENIASRQTGVYEQDGTVYFHSLSVRASSDDDSTCRRKALLAVQKMMVDWVVRHAPPFDSMPKSIQKIDKICTRYGTDFTTEPFKLHVSGRGFTVESEGTYAYGFAVPLNELLREARKGVPGKTEKEILARWRAVCARELKGRQVGEFLSLVGCGNLCSVPQEFGEKLPAEWAFLDGWDGTSRIAALMKTTGRIDPNPEDLWLEGLNLISDLKDGKLLLGNSGSRLQAALLETPGSPVLWCYLGQYLKGLRLYRLSAVAYKNAFCLSSDIGLYPLLKDSSENLAYIYRMLHRDSEADAFELLSIGTMK